MNSISKVVKRYYYYQTNGIYFLDWSYMDITKLTKRGNYKLSNGEVYDRNTKKCLNYQRNKHIPEQYKRNFIEVVWKDEVLTEKDGIFVIY